MGVPQVWVLQNEIEGVIDDPVVIQQESRALDDFLDMAASVFNTSWPLTLDELSRSENVISVQDRKGFLQVSGTDCKVTLWLCSMA